MSKGPKAPKPTQQELNLQQSQADMLNQQRDMLTKQLHQQDLLAPYLYKQANLEPVYGADGQISGFNDLGPTPEEQAYKQLLESQVRSQKYTDALLPLQLQQEGYTIQTDADGNPTGITVMPGGAADLQNQYLQSQLETGKQQQEMNQQFLDRSAKAMRGELPVDPSLEREFGRSEAVLRASLAKNLGSGYETSTPGIQALAEFNQRKGDTIYAAQHGEIGSAAQLGMAGQAANLVPAMRSPWSNVNNAGTAGQFLNPFAAQGNPAARSAQVLGAVQAPYAGSGGLGTLSQLYGEAQNPLFRQRQFEYGANVNRNNNALGNILGRNFMASFGQSTGKMASGETALNAAGSFM